MEEKKSFLKILEDRDVDFDFKLFDENGYDEKLKIPVDWIYSKDITREDFVEACQQCILKAVKYMGMVKGKSSQEAVDNYNKNSKYKNPGKDNITDFEIRKGENGKVYLLIKGLDNYTQVVISQDDDYIESKGSYKIKESVFIKVLKEISDKRKVEEFLQRNGGTLNSENLDIKDIYRLMETLSNNDVEKQFSQAGKDLAKYANYIRNEQENYSTSVISCKVAEEEVGKKGPRGKNPKPAPTRLNDVIDAKQRYDILNSFNPEYIIKINPSAGLKNRYQFQAYTYDLSKRNKGEDGSIIIIEPVNGTSYTRIIHISQNEIEDMMNNGDMEKIEVFENVIAENLAKTRSVLTLDKKTILTNEVNPNC